jgi:ABC-2 type transport system permease protein
VAADLADVRRRVPAEGVKPPAAAGWRPPRRFGAVNWLGLWTLYRRDVLRALKNYRDSLLGPAVGSLLFLAVFALAMASLAGPAPASLPGGLSVLQFLAPGLVIFTVCAQAFETAAASILYDKLEGMIQDMVMAPLSALERTVAYALSAATVGLLAGLVVAGAVLLFVDLPFAAPVLLPVFALGGALMHALLGILVGMWAVRWENFAAALAFVVIPLAYLSGTFYPVEHLPELGQRLVALNPVHYVIEGFRAGLAGTSGAALAIGLLVTLGVNVALAGFVHKLFARGYRLKP